MEPVTIEVERIDPAEALRRIRTEVQWMIALRRRDRDAVLAIIDRHWPNGAQP